MYRLSFGSGLAPRCWVL